MARRIVNRQERIERPKAETVLQRRDLDSRPARKPSLNPVRRIRLENGLTQAELAARCGNVCQLTISKAETGVVKHSGRLFDGLRRAGLLTAESEPLFFEDWQKWLAHLYERRQRRADLGSLIDELPKEELVVLLTLVAERMARDTLKPVGPFAR